MDEILPNDGEYELYKKHRPTLFKHVIGQPDAIRILNGFVSQNKIPHAMLFTGPSGCGKTTLARIMRAKLKCDDIDFAEINGAEARGIDDIRDIEQRMLLAPLKGTCRVWLIDEAHQLTKDAQSVLLKMLEDTPRHVYFMLATTDPAKLRPEIRTRCTEVTVKGMGLQDLRNLVNEVAEAENTSVSPKLLETIVEAAEGSARKALVYLGQVLAISNEEDKINAISKSSTEAFGIDIARLLINPSTKWNDIKGKLKNLNDDPEKVRRIILGYATTVILSGGKFNRCKAILKAFQYNFFDSGLGGLVSACADIVSEG